MQFIKTRDVKSPVRDVNENAGIDFYIPENNTEFIQDLQAKNVGLKIVSNDLSEYSSEGKFIRHIDKAERTAMLEQVKLSYFDYESGTIFIAPHKAIIIPTGIKSKFTPNLALIANNKSGIATKKQLIFGASVIDASYQGEWHINLINTSDYYQSVKCGEKAIQFIPHVISTDPVEIVDMTAEEFYKDSNSKRGEGWQGSTGLK